MAGVFDLQGQTATLLHPFRPIGRGGWFPAPTWSPNGRWLVLHAETGNAMGGLWVAATDGSREEQVTQSVNSRAFWSPPGSEPWQNGGYLAISPAAAGAGGDYLVLVTESWHEVPLYIPEGGVIVGWRATG